MVLAADLQPSMSGFEIQAPLPMLAKPPDLYEFHQVWLMHLYPSQVLNRPATATGYGLQVWGCWAIKAFTAPRAECSSFPRFLSASITKSHVLLPIFPYGASRWCLRGFLEAIVSLMSSQAILPTRGPAD